MESLRIFVQWIQRHRWVTLTVILLTLALTFYFPLLITRSQGTLSKPIQRGAIMDSVYGIGTVMANRSYQIRVGVVGTLVDLYVKEGDSVQRGDPLAKIDRNTYRAPFKGTVTNLPFKVGENVFVQVPILTLVDLQDRYLVVSLEQQGALRVQRSQKVKLSFDTLHQKHFDGQITAVYSNGSDFLARIDISDLPREILPGMTADVAIQIQSHENVLLIPVEALQNGNTVWVKNGHGMPRKVEIKIGIVDKAMAEVSKGSLWISS